MATSSKLTAAEANQGRKSHADMEATLTHYINTTRHITVTKAKSFPDGEEADIFLSLLPHTNNSRPRANQL
jgi:hypothetical protein